MSAPNPSSTDTAELLPCPFCKSKASFIKNDFPPIGFRYGVECRECDCRCDYRKTTQEEAAAQWNWRPGDVAQAAPEPKGCSCPFDGCDPCPACRATQGGDKGEADEIGRLSRLLRASHQNCLALWEALEGGASPRCHDCADFNGRCQGNGPACEPQERALERIKEMRRQLAAPQPTTAAYESASRGDLTKLAAECHRAKWEFALGDDELPKAAVARSLIANAFNALHRIGDLALKLRDASSLPSTEGK